MTEYCEVCRQWDLISQKCSGLKKPAEEMRKKCPYMLADSTGWVDDKAVRPRANFEVLLYTTDIRQIIGYLETIDRKEYWRIPLDCGMVRAWRPLPKYPTFVRDDE